MVKVLVRDLARGVDVAEFRAAPAHVAIIHVERRGGETLFCIPGVHEYVIAGPHTAIEIHNLNTTQGG